MSLLQAKAFVHQPLQARAVDQVVGELLIRKHAQGSAAGVGSHFRRLFQSESGVLADDRHHHAHHHLQPTQSSRLLDPLVFPALLGSFGFHSVPGTLATPALALRRSLPEFAGDANITPESESLELKAGSRGIYLDVDPAPPVSPHALLCHDQRVTQAAIGTIPRVTCETESQ